MFAVAALNDRPIITDRVLRQFPLIAPSLAGRDWKTGLPEIIVADRRPEGEANPPAVEHDPARGEVSEAHHCAAMHLSNRLFCRVHTPQHRLFGLPLTVVLQSYLAANR